MGPPRAAESDIGEQINVAFQGLGLGVTRVIKTLSSCPGLLVCASGGFMFKFPIV